jgi:hypothetical protein
MPTYTTDKYGNTYADNQFVSGPGGNYYHPTPQVGADGKTAAEKGQYDPNSEIAPDIPDYQPVWDNAYSMADYMKPQLDQIQVDKQGLAAFKGEALRTGPGAWAGAASAENDRGAKTARNQASLDAKGGVAQAESGLAMHGGIDSGARERIAQTGQNAYAMAGQEIGNQQAQGRNQILMQDEKNRVQELEALPGVQNQYLEPEFKKASMSQAAHAADVQGQIHDTEQQNAYNMGKFSIQAQEFGANQQANATRQSGGNWVVTELSKHFMLPGDARECLTAIRFVAATLDRRALAFYLKHGPGLVRRLNARDFDWAMFSVFVDEVCDLVRAGEPEAAFHAYQAKMMKLMQIYWPDCPSRQYQRMREKRIRRIATLGAIVPPHSTLKGRLRAQCGGNIPDDRFERVN